MRRIVLLLLCMVPIAIHAEDRSITMDGTYWKGLTHEQKVNFIEGYTEGWEFGFDRGQYAADPNLKVAKVVGTEDEDTSGITFGTLVEGVDKCYDDYRNSNISVKYCVAWATMGIHGVKASALENLMVAMRKQFK
jgi:hypothetical protein